MISRKALETVISDKEATFVWIGGWTTLTLSLQFHPVQKQNEATVFGVESVRIDLIPKYINNLAHFVSKTEQNCIESECGLD